MAEIHTLKFGPQLLEDAELVTAGMAADEGAKDIQVLAERHHDNRRARNELCTILGLFVEARLRIDKLEGRG